MTAPSLETDTTHSSAKQPAAPRYTAVTLIFGLGLSALLQWLLACPPLAVFGLWLLGPALALIAGALIRHHILHESPWHLALLGQALGMVGIALLLLASLI